MGAVGNLVYIAMVSCNELCYSLSNLYFQVFVSWTWCTVLIVFPIELHYFVMQSLVFGFASWTCSSIFRSTCAGFSPFVFPGV